MKSSFSKNDNLLIVFLALFRSAVALKEPVFTFMVMTFLVGGGSEKSRF